jgi:hypothetical protein
LSSCLLSQNIKIKKYIIVTVLVSYKCKTWPFLINKEHRLSLFKNRMLGKMFVQEQDAKEDVWAEDKASISPSQEIRIFPTY